MTIATILISLVGLDVCLPKKKEKKRFSSRWVSVAYLFCPATHISSEYFTD
jgi:hypothetical protein